MRRLLSLALALFVLAAAPPAVAAPAMWLIKDANSTIVLFGSVHMLPRGLKWRPSGLDQALNNADDVWFEIPLDAYAAAEASAEAGRRAMLPPGQTLSSLLDPASLTELQKQAKALKIPMEQLDMLQPWMAEVQISIAALEVRGDMANDGVEEQLNALTPRTVIRRAFETPVEQIDILAGDDMATQMASLKESLHELATDPKAYDRMLKAWLDGDAKRLSREVIDPMKAITPGSYKSLVLNRNTAWVDIIAKRLAGSGRTVMVVGAGHLVGPDSVPAQLRARGIAVEGP